MGTKEKKVAKVEGASKNEKQKQYRIERNVRLRQNQLAQATKAVREVIAKREAEGSEVTPNMSAMATAIDNGKVLKSLVALKSVLGMTDEEFAYVHAQSVAAKGTKKTLDDLI